jgi:hypothetical protein
MRVLATWLLTLPLIGSGLLLAHELSYRAVEPHTHSRDALLQSTGHGYLGHLPLAAALGASMLVIGVALLSARAFRGKAALRLRVWPFAVLPPFAFAVQEHLERMVHTGELSVSTALAPTFVLGLLLQAPFALAAFLIARALLALAHRLGRLIGSTPAAAPTAVVLLPTHRLDHPRRPVLARGWAGRAPPLPLAA